MIRSDRIRTLQDALASLRTLQEQTRVALEATLARSDAGPAAWRGATAALEARLAAHVRALDEALMRIDGTPSSWKETVGAAIGTVASWLESARSGEPRSRLLRDVLGALGFVRGEALRVRGIALALDDRPTAGLVSDQLDELSARARELEESLEQVLRAELEEGDKVAPGAPGTNEFKEERR